MDGADPDRLGPATTTEVDRSRPTPRSVLCVPLGATEQHGPHLPLDTDTRVAVAWAEALSQHRPGFMVAPALPYGSSGEHQGFAGTLSIGQEALRSVLLELIRSAAHTFSAVVLVCGHAGNAEPVLAVTRQARHEGHRVVALLPSWDEPADGEGSLTIDAHAGRTETSLLLHLCPEVVRQDRLQPGVTGPVTRFLPRLRRDGVAAVSPNGILGDPSGASADEGRRLFDLLVQRAIDELGAL